MNNNYNINKWTFRFLALALFVSKFSKDPSTQVGAVLVKDKNNFISFGYNGLPKTMDDDPKILNIREEKYKHILHAEENAIYNSNTNVEGATLFVTNPPCLHCTSVLAQNGIKEVVYLNPSEDYYSRWNKEEIFDALAKNNINCYNVSIDHGILEEYFNGLSKLI